MESETDMEQNIKKEEGEGGFRDISNEAVNQGQTLDNRQFKAHTFKTTEDILSDFEEKLAPPDKPRITVDKPDFGQGVGPSAAAAAATKRRPAPCLCEKRNCMGTFCKCFTYGFYCGEGCLCKDGCLNNYAGHQFDAYVKRLYNKDRTSLCRCSNKTHCSNKYCGCVKINQRCLPGCKCVGCTNPYGEK